MKMKKKWLIGVVVLLGVSLGIYFFLSSRKTENPAVASVETYTVTRGDLLVSVSGSGVLEAKDTVDVTSEIGGTVLWVAEEGSKVKKGDIVCKIDPYDYEVALNQAELTYRNAKLKLDQARINLENQKKQLEQNIRDAKTNRDNAYIELQKAKRQLDDAERLYRVNAITLNDLKTYRDNYSKALNTYNQTVENLRLLESTKADKLAQAERDVLLAETSLEQAKVDLEKAKRNLSKTTIYAPIDGIVADVSVKKGGQNIAKEITLMSILDTSTMKIKLEVDETDIPKVRIGLPVKVTCEAFSDKEFRGKVTNISPRATISNNIAIFKVEVEIPNPTGELRAGMTAEGEIILKEQRNVLLVPLKAVKRTERRAYVEVLKDNGERELTRVTLGEDDGINVVVESGLKEGDKIVLASSSPTASSSTRNPNPSPFRIFR